MRMEPISGYYMRQPRRRDGHSRRVGSDVVCGDRTTAGLRFDVAVKGRSSCLRIYNLSSA